MVRNLDFILGEMKATEMSYGDFEKVPLPVCEEWV